MKMGRFKGLFCSFCLNRSSTRPHNSQSFDQGIDVSHLATPHISSNLSLPVKPSVNSTPINDGNEGGNHQDQNNYSSVVSNNSTMHHNNSLDTRIELINQDNNHSPSFQHSDNNQSLPSPELSAPNHHEAQASQEQPSTSDRPQSSSASPQQHHQQQQPYSNQNAQVIVYQPQQDIHNLNNATNAGARLSYDIISVREPLAKILAERQQLQQAQQQQRQISGDHEYIEISGDRGSSCFYEEIAGSTTSSATYDQIGASSNHNYQVLINAYAVRPNGTSRSTDNENRLVVENDSQELSNQESANAEENLYDSGQPTDLTDNPANNIPCSKSPSSHGTNNSTLLPEPSTSQQSSSDRNTMMSQSIPVYSVINKAARRSNAIIRASVDNSRPPQPPPKNLLINHQSTATSAIQIYQEPTTNTQNSNGSRIVPQIPTTSSYLTNNNTNIDTSESNEYHPRLPQPPPRLSKNNSHSSTNRPLPFPETFDNVNISTNNSAITHRSQDYDEDVESVNNGYELLTTNFDDDQVDVGYEKIRESNRYSGGSLTSQFCPLQALDNGGYESVQPIYSSPSNALAEPNYEAIGPSTASELAAAATARLTAAAAVIELLKQDQN